MWSHNGSRVTFESRKKTQERGTQLVGERTVIRCRNNGLEDSRTTITELRLHQKLKLNSTILTFLAAEELRSCIRSIWNITKKGTESLS